MLRFFFVIGQSFTQKEAKKGDVEEKTKKLA